MEKGFIALVLIFVALFAFIFIMYPDIATEFDFDREPAKGFVERDEAKQAVKEIKTATNYALEYDWEKNKYMWDCHYSIAEFDFVCYSN